MIGAMMYLWIYATMVVTILISHALAIRGKGDRLTGQLVTLDEAAEILTKDLKGGNDEP